MTSRLDPRVRLALSGAGLWVFIEFAIRAALPVAILAPGILAGRRPDDSSLALLSGAVDWPAMVLLGLLFYRRARREGLTPADLGYGPLRPALVVGVTAAVALEGMHRLADRVTDYVFGVEGLEHMDRIYLAGGRAPMLLLLGSNGIVGPIVEELAWRGYIQRHLVTAWGPALGVGVTSLLFAAKHVVVDLTLLRVVLLVTLSSAYGVVGFRWGTTAASIAHLLSNFLATFQMLLQVW